MPTTPALQSMDITVTNAVATVNSIFTGGTQTQMWPGADMWSGTATYAPLSKQECGPIKAALLQMRGMSNAIQLGDPMWATPLGTPQGSPVVDGSIAISVGGQTLYTRNWTPSQLNLLRAGDMIQVGYRLYCVLDDVISDSNGKAAISISPSLREIPSDGEIVVTNNAVGLFRLNSNKVTWSSDYTGLIHLSFPVTEFR
jgi:hypothetical protein